MVYLKKHINLLNAFLIILFLGILTLVILKANLLSFTHDESLTYTIVSGDNSWKHTANNHLLNTLLMRATNSLFGNSELALRLPNIIAFIIFSLALFKLVKLSRHFILSLLLLSLTLLNPFLLEFFSLARGYGLAIGFMTLSSFYLIRNGLNSNSFKILLSDFILTSLFACLATYSNLNAINFFISIILIFIVKFWIYIKNNSTQKKHYFYFLGVLVFSAIPLIENIKWLLFLNRQNQLYYGANSLIESFNSFFNSSFYFKTTHYTLLSCIFLTLLLAFLIFAIYSIVKNIKDNHSFYIPTILLLFSFLGVFAEKIFFGAKLPYERTSLFYIPLLSIFIYTLFSYFYSMHRLKIITIVISIFILTPLVYNFIIGVNLTQTKTWSFDKHNKTILLHLNKTTKFYNKKHTISPNWLCEPSFNFYIQTLGLNFEKVNRSSIDTKCDFLYKLNDSSRTEGFISLVKYTDINSELLVKDNLFH